MVENNVKEHLLKFTPPKSGRKIVNRLTPTYSFVEQIEKDTIVIREYDGKTKTVEAKVEEIYTFICLVKRSNLN